ncbi:MAG: DUF4114 domain-containing protein [Candidatus Omnitrophota bacterium]|jgi:hypothetical protein|nr:MAG: DUF4114 domain-containing protein [Candidatus Omnitrophota bacterium]
MKKLLFLTAALILGVSVVSYAALIDLGMATGSGELKMFEIYNAMYSTGFTNNDQLEALEVDLAIGGGKYKSNSGTVGLVARYASAPVTLRYYDSGGDHDLDPALVNLAGGSALYAPPVITFYTVTGTEEFGMWGLTSAGKFYSEKSLNADGKYHFLVLSTPDPKKFLIGFEDRSAGADWDYNDFVFETYNIFATPEPTSMLLLGMGALGLLGLKRKKA